MSRVKFIAQKRTALKGQMTSLQNLIDQNRIDLTNMKMRIKRITDLFHAYEELHDELAGLDPESDALNELEEIRDKYYELGSKINNLEMPSTSQNETLNTTSIQIDRNLRLKLPIAELPHFDGTVENWLSFKNTFVTMIDSREDLTDLQKFLYLKNCLKGDASAKISIYNVSEEHYKNAWKLLVESYEKRRIIIAKHIDAIIKLTSEPKASAKDLISFVDNARQHLNVLESLNVKINNEFLTRIAEGALPNKIRSKWEETLDLDKFPTFEQLCKFITETAFRLSTIEPVNSRVTSDNNNKKRTYTSVDKRPSKNRKQEPNARALVSNTSPAICPSCKKENHFLFRCPSFIKASVTDRWEIVNKIGVCRNCLRSHSGHCKLSHCKKCNRFHNNLLHYEKSNPSSATSSSTSSAVAPKQTGKQAETSTSKQM